ncbi:MAG: hypothetical protein AAF467_15080 [Actinomycetota bacterium]
MTEDPWADLVGQDAARARLEAAAEAPVHAYLFVGNEGSGSFAAARAFAGLLLAAAHEAPTGFDFGEGEGEGDDGAAGADADRARHIRLARDGTHPDLTVVAAEGAALRVSEAENIIRAGLRSPVEGNRKVIVVRGIDAIEEAAIGKLLKVIEEPPPSAVFVLLAEEVPPELVTIASRCVNVEFGPLSIAQITGALLARGVEPERAEAAATAAGGDLDRAMLLASDDGLAARAAGWQRVPERLDGTGSTVVALVNELRAGMDEAVGPLEARQRHELEALEERVEQLGERGSGRADLIARHKREVRRQRGDELRFGMATLARVYRDRLIAGPDAAAEAALREIQRTTENLVRNPNEPLTLQHLLLTLRA